MPDEQGDFDAARLGRHALSVLQEIDQHCRTLWTHSEPPTAAAAPDSLEDRPTDQPASPIQGLPATMRSRMRIDTYGKPDGWTMTLQASIDGELWQRSIDCGTDPSRNAEWQAITLP